MTSSVMWRLKACQKDKKHWRQSCKKRQSERGCDLEGGLHDGHDRCVTQRESTGCPSFSGKHLSLAHLVDSSKPACTIRSPVASQSKPRTGGLPVVNCFLLRSKLRLVSACESGPEGPTRPTRPEPPTTRLVHTAARHRPAPPLIGNNCQLSKTPIVHKITSQQNLESK